MLSSLGWPPGRASPEAVGEARSARSGPAAANAPPVVVVFDDDTKEEAVRSTLHGMPCGAHCDLWSQIEGPQRDREATATRLPEVVVVL